MAVHTEIRFEEAIERHLLSKAGGYWKGDARGFDPRLALFPDDVISFIQATQEPAWKAIASYHGGNARAAVLDDLAKALSSPAMGVLHVLRQGFTCFGKTLRVAYFAPANLMNPETARQYAANRLTVTRQVHYSEKNDKLSIDVVLALNGMPFATLELKNPLTHQNVHDAMRQYREDRDPREPLFRFKERALVHFAVDPDLVYMTTKLDGKATHFLPFNRGDQGSAGNPPNPDGYRTAYLWEEVLQRDSLLDILGRFVQLEKIEKDVLITKGGKEVVQKIRKENVIFPRYHQLDAVRRLTTATRQGAGRNYLVQHSAGSGKSNTIAWLAHRLSTLHDAEDAKVFDSVIVITDRRVLDRQLQDTSTSSSTRGRGQEDRRGLNSTGRGPEGWHADRHHDAAEVPVRDREDRHAAGAEVRGDRRRGAQLAVRRAGAELKGMLNDAALRAKAKKAGAGGGQRRRGLRCRGAPADHAQAGPAAEHQLLRLHRDAEIQDAQDLRRAGAERQAAVPPVHDAAGDRGGFILDVLRNYTTYKAYYRLIETAAEDPLVEKKEAAKALARFMRHHPTQPGEQGGGHGRALPRPYAAQDRRPRQGDGGDRLATAAVRYKQAFDKYIKRQGLPRHPDAGGVLRHGRRPGLPGKSYSEQGMNGIQESQLPRSSRPRSTRS
jgi:type I restriction enzyme, R subunit